MLLCFVLKLRSYCLCRGENSTCQIRQAAAPLCPGIFGAGSELVIAGLAVLAIPDEQNDASDQRDQAKEVPSAGFSDVMQASPGNGESRNQGGQTENRLELPV